MKIKISVTQDDINNGIDNDGCNCPVALALKRAFPALPGLIAGMWTWYPNGDDPFGEDLPEEAQEFILRFDSGDPVRPLAFDLDVPDELAATS